MNAPVVQAVFSGGPVDAAIARAVARPVRWWVGRVSGSTQGPIARTLLVVALLVMALLAVLMSLSFADVGTVDQVLGANAVVVWSYYCVRTWRWIRLCDEMAESLREGAIRIDPFLVNRIIGSRRVDALVTVGLLVVDVLARAVPIFAVVLALLTLAEYVTLCLTVGGGTSARQRATERIKRAAERLRRAPLAPAPSPA